MRKRPGLAVVLSMLVFFLVPAQAEAGWREEAGTFRVGVIAAHWLGRDMLAREKVENAYAEVLGMPVDVFVAPDYEALIKAQVSGYVHYAVYSAAAFALARRLCACVEPLVAPVDVDGSIGFRSVLLLRKPLPETSAGIAARRIAIGPADSVTGSALPLAAFRPEGLPLSGEEDFLVRVRSASRAEAMFAGGEVDGLFGWQATGTTAPGVGGTAQRIKAAGMAPGSFDVYWRSEVVRYGPHVLREGVAERARALLEPFLTGLAESDSRLYADLEEGHGGGFETVAVEDYDTANALLDFMQSAARP